MATYSIQLVSNEQLLVQTTSTLLNITFEEVMQHLREGRQHIVHAGHEHG